MSEIHFNHDVLKLKFYLPSIFSNSFPISVNGMIFHPLNCTKNLEVTLITFFFLIPSSKPLPNPIYFTDKVCLNLVASAIPEVQAAMPLSLAQVLMLHFPFSPFPPDDFPYSSQSDLWLLNPVV